jgi:cytochrome c
MRHSTTLVAASTSKAGYGALMILLVAAGSAFAQPESVLAKRGEALLSRECGICHAVGRYGDSPQRNAPSFYEIARRRDLAEIRQSLEKGTLSGHPEMPRVSLSGNDIEAVLAYLSAIRQP